MSARTDTAAVVLRDDFGLRPDATTLESICALREQALGRMLLISSRADGGTDEYFAPAGDGGKR